MYLYWGIIWSRVLSRRQIGLAIVRRHHEVFAHGAHVRAHITTHGHTLPNVCHRAGGWWLDEKGFCGAKEGGQEIQHISLESLAACKGLARFFPEGWPSFGYVYVCFIGMVQTNWARQMVLGNTLGNSQTELNSSCWVHIPEFIYSLQLSVILHTVTQC